MCVRLQQLTRRKHHIFTDNKDDDDVAPFLPPVVPSGLVHNESDPLIGGGVGGGRGSKCATAVYVIIK